jgi:ribosomal protein S18 acetylase RimI-like enzyme
MTLFRDATSADIETCMELIDLNEREFDPEAKSAGAVHVEEILNGYFSEVYSRLLIRDGVATAFINIHGDDVRETYFPDIYVRPGTNDWEAALMEMESIIDSSHPQWRVLMSVNGRDEKTKELITGHGYSFIRKYWGMEAQVPENLDFSLPADIEIRKIDIENEIELWHAAHQDAFSTHFGFKPRPLDKWRALVLEATSLDLEGTFLMFKEGRCIGFLESSTEMEHENSGYISAIGVIKSEQGRGYGALLIKQALAYASSKGLTKLNLNVDTGNTTSALFVYERQGFAPNFSWEQYCKEAKEQITSQQEL